MKLITVGVMALALAFPSLAKADPFPDRVTGAVPAPDLATDVAQAKIYWQNRGLTWDCDISDVWWADSVHTANPQSTSDEIMAVGYVGGCGIVLRKLRYPQLTPWTDQERFSLVVHEMGHNVGLEHDDPRFPVMSGSIFDLVSPEAAIPAPAPKAKVKKVAKKKAKKCKKYKKSKKCKKRNSRN